MRLHCIRWFLSTSVRGAIHPLPRAIQDIILWLIAAQAPQSVTGDKKIVIADAAGNISEPRLQWKIYLHLGLTAFMLGILTRFCGAELDSLPDTFLEEHLLNMVKKQVLSDGIAFIILHAELLMKPQGLSHFNHSLCPTNLHKLCNDSLVWKSLHFSCLKMKAKNNWL